MASQLDVLTFEHERQHHSRVVTVHLDPEVDICRFALIEGLNPSMNGRISWFLFTSVVNRARPQSLGQVVRADAVEVKSSNRRPFLEFPGCVLTIEHVSNIDDDVAAFSDADILGSVERRHAGRPSWIGV